MAKDLNSLSDDELLKTAAKHGISAPKPAAGSLEEMSDEDLLKLADLSGVSVDRAPSDIPESFALAAGNRVGGLLGKGLSKVGELNEKYLAAPTRSGLAAAFDNVPVQEKIIPGVGMGKMGFQFAKGFAGQFGEDPTKGVSPSELRGRLVSDETLGDRSLSDAPFIKNLYSESGSGLPLKKGGLLDPTLKGTADFVTDLAADVGNVIPFEKAITPFVKPAFKGAKIAGEAAKGVAKKVGEKAISAEAKVASAFTGIPENIVKNYAKNGKAVDELITKYGGNSSQAADAIREQYQTQLRNFKNKANEDISKALATKADELTNVSPALQNLEKSKASLNTKTKVAERAQIQEHIDVLKSMADEEGNIALKDLFDAKEYLQDAGKSSYVKNGQLFTPGKDSARAAKNGARELRQILNKAAPDIAEANNKLALLHNAEDGLNKNLIKPGGPDAALMTAGSQPMSRQRGQLERLSKVSGVPMAQKAEDLATARTFANPELLPVDTTGKSPGRIAAGAGIGFLKGGPAGAAVGAALTSPLALKYGIKTQRGLLQAAEKIGGLIGKPADWVLEHPEAFSQGLIGGVRKYKVKEPKE